MCRRLLIAGSVLLIIGVGLAIYGWSHAQSQIGALETAVAEMSAAKTSGDEAPWIVTGTTLSFNNPAVLEVRYTRPGGSGQWRRELGAGLGNAMLGIAEEYLDCIEAARIGSVIPDCIRAAE